MDPASNLTVAMLSSYPPRECGIAMFTVEVQQALAAQGAPIEGIVAIDEPGARRSYDSDVLARVEQENPTSYQRLAPALHDAGVDLLCIQHEYNLFGGLDGELLLTALDQLRIPVVTVLHSTLAGPTQHMRTVTRSLCDRSDAVIVLTRFAISLLHDVYGIDPRKINFIPHGIPSVPYMPRGRYRAKAQLGQTDATLLSTFGLLVPGKGIEYAIRALPEVAQEYPDVRYYVLGKTHPVEYRHNGESYRMFLQELVAELSLGEHVRFDARYLDHDELIQWLLATDIYLAPYVDTEHSVSGPLAFAVGCGRVAISTQFRYARELLDGGHGEIVPFADPEAIRTKLLGLLGDRPALAAMERRAYTASRQMQWPIVADSYSRVFATAASRRGTTSGNDINPNALAPPHG